MKFRFKMLNLDVSYINSMITALTFWCMTLAVISSIIRCNPDHYCFSVQVSKLFFGVILVIGLANWMQARNEVNRMPQLMIGSFHIFFAIMAFWFFHQDKEFIERWMSRFMSITLICKTILVVYIQQTELHQNSLIFV